MLTKWTEDPNFWISSLSFLVGTILTIRIFNWTRKNNWIEEFDSIRKEILIFNANNWFPLLLRTNSFFDKFQKRHHRKLSCESCGKKSDIGENWKNVYEKLSTNKINEDELSGELWGEIVFVRTLFAIYFYDKLQLKIKLFHWKFYRVEYFFQGLCYSCIEQKVSDGKHPSMTIVKE